MSKLQRRTILIVCCWGMTLLSLATITPAIGLTVIGDDLGMNNTQKGAFLGAGFWGITLAIFLSGALADRIGFRIPLVASAVMQAAGCLLISLADKQWMASAGAFVAGAGSGSADALFTPIICSVFPDRRKSMSNLLHTFYPVGLIITIVLMMSLMQIGWHWRAVFRILALLPLPFVVAVCFLPLPAHAHQGPERMRTRHILLKGPFILLGVGIFLVGVTEMAPMGWLPDFVARTAKGTQFQGQIGLLLCSVMLMLGRLSGSALVEKLLG